MSSTPPLMQRDRTDGPSSPLQWKVLVVDETSRKFVNSAAKEEEILNLNVSSESSLPRHEALSAKRPP